MTEESSASDVFRVIFSAMATSEPWKSLLMHAVVLRNPLFAELAGCCVSPLHYSNDDGDDDVDYDNDSCGGAEERPLC